MVFVPAANSEAVKKLREFLGMDKDAVRLKVSVQSGAQEKNCYVNVQDRIDKNGGGRQLGWAVWQHFNLFIEAEPHAVYDPSNGNPWIDCTPHILPDGGRVGEILFIPNAAATYDFNTTDLADNVRVPLVDDPRVLKALKLFSEKTSLMNSVPGVNVNLPQDVARKVKSVVQEASALIGEALRPPFPGYGLALSAGAESKLGKIGRNDPCPCGSGKKFKKCCGSAA
jgi:SEC-C motif